MRSTRGGKRNQNRLRTRNRRKTAAEIARKASEQAQHVIEKAKQLQQEIMELSRTQKDEMEKIVLELIRVPKDKSKTILLLKDYIGDFTIRLDTLLKNPPEHISMNSSIHFKKDLIRQYSNIANQLSNNSYAALDLSTKTLLSNRPNQIANHNANEEMQRILAHTQHVQPHPFPEAFEQSSLYSRMNLAIQIAHAMEYITYIYLVKTRDPLDTRDPFSLRMLSISEKQIKKSNELRPTIPDRSNNTDSNFIRTLIGIAKLIDERGSKPTGSILSIPLWITDATDIAWVESISSAISYYETIPEERVGERSLTIFTIFQLYCQRFIYNLFLRFPVMEKNGRRDPVMKTGTLPFIGDPQSSEYKQDPLFRLLQRTLVIWQKTEEAFKQDPSTLLRFNEHHLSRLALSKWLHDSYQARPAVYKR